MNRGIVETFLGAVVLLFAVGFAVYVYSSREVQENSTYELSMRFNSVQGLKSESEVRLGGVKIGHVQDLSLDEISLQALVLVEIDERVQLPVDSRAEIATAGLLGGNFVHIIPGNAQDVIVADGELTNTKDPVSLEDLLGQAIFALSKK